MQTPKARPGSLEVPQKTSPATPRTARKLKTPGSGSDAAAAASSPNPVSKMPKDRSPKVVDRRSPRSPAIEKKRPSRVSELETQLAQLQDELKKAKDQLSSSESWKRKAQQEVEEAKKQLAAMSEKLEETQKQLQELSDSEDARVQELRKISQDRDRAWQSELEAIQKQHSLDSTALVSAMNEIQRLNIQLDRMAESEAAQARRAEAAHGEIQKLRVELTETLALVEKLKSQVAESKEFEAQALEEVSNAQMQLQVAMMTQETLRGEGLKARDAYDSLISELEKSKNQESLLQELVGKLQADHIKTDASSDIKQQNGEDEEADQLESELKRVKLEVSQLRSALEAAERRYEEEYIQGTMQIRSAYELVERTKTESCQRECELEGKLEVARAEFEKLKETLMDREIKLLSISEENEGLNQKVEESGKEELEFELEKSNSVLAELKATLLDKEAELQNIYEENDILKSEIKEREIERSKLNDEALTLAESARAAEREALMKLGDLTEEADKSSKKAARVHEQLDAAQASNAEMEAELRRLKVQSDQWRKAAEAAAAMLSTGNNGKYVERTGSLDYHTLGGKMGSPFAEDIDDESPKKKNGNMLRRISFLLKKGQK